MKKNTTPQRFFYPAEIETAHLRFVALMDDAAAERDSKTNLRPILKEMNELAEKIAEFHRDQAQLWLNRCIDLATKAQKLR